MSALAVVAAIGLLLGHIDHPWMKRRLQEIVRSKTGFEIDYATVRVRPLSGVRIEELSLLTPPELRGVARDLVRVGRLEVGWSLSRASRRMARLERLEVEDVAVTIVEDERGRTSLGLLPKLGGAQPGATGEPSPSPLSGTPPLHRLEIVGVHLAWVRVRGAQILERSALRGLALRAETRSVTPNGWGFDAEAGSSSAPVSLAFIRDGSAVTAGEAHLELRLSGHAEPSSVSVVLDLRVTDQTFAPLVPVREALHLEARADLDPALGATGLSVTQARLADGAVTLETQLALPDGPGAAPLVRRATSTVDLERLSRALPPGLVPLAGQGTIAVRASGIELAHVPRLLPDGSLTADVDVPTLRLEVAGGVASAQGARSTLTIGAGPDGPTARASADLQSFRWATPQREVRGQGITVRADATRTPDAAWSGTGVVGLRSLRLAGREPLALGTVRVGAKVSRLRIDPASPLAATGEIELAGDVGTLDARMASAGVGAKGVTLRLHSRLTGGAPFAARLEALARELRLFGSRASPLLIGPGQLDLSLSDIAPVPSRPVKSRAVLRGSARLGRLRASLDATKRSDSLSFTLAAGTTEQPIGQFVPGATGLGSITVALSANGHVEPIWSGPPGGAVDFRAQEIEWRAADRTIAAPSLTGHAVLRTAGTKRRMEGDVQLRELHLLSGIHRVDVAGVESRAAVTLPDDTARGDTEVAVRLSLRSLIQNFASYPIGDLSLSASGRRDVDGFLRISELRFENPAAGTSLTARGLLELGFERRRLAVRGQLKQDLARLWRAPETFQGRGQVGVTFRVASSDFVVFRTQAGVRLDDVHAEFPRAKVSLESVDGEIPISSDVAIDPHGVTLLRGVQLNPFSLHRFADQHPLLERSSFLSIGKITSPIASIAPLAGNLKIEQNVVSVSQLEMGLRGGRVTGECVLDWNGMKSTMQAHVRATGVLSSHDEPFDGNAAVVVSVGERTVDGRVEILRIGSRHLLDLLDLQDPLRIDPAINRIRQALALGYPDKVRVAFNRGFAKMRVTFGGVASLLSVGDVRGIPTGPLIDRMIAPFLPSEVP